MTDPSEEFANVAEDDARVIPGRICNRTACCVDGATWWNNSTLKWYCRSCAMKINEHAPGLCVEMPREKYLPRLRLLIDALPPDELRVLLSLAEGLYVGLTAYSPLDIKNDKRDFRREANEELRDALIYITLKSFKQE